MQAECLFHFLPLRGRLEILFRAEAQKLYRFINPDINVGVIERQNAKGFSPDKKINDKFPNSH